jgi:RimJ/RimL family protein N-acetyltransferase
VKVYARDALGLTRLLAIVSPDNAGSIRLLERLGFRFETMVPSPDGRGELRLFAADAL